MTSRADRARDMGGVPELLSWQERYSKNNKFCYLDALAGQMRREMQSPLPRTDYSTRPRSRAGHIQQRDQLHDMYTAAAAGADPSSFSPSSSGTMNMMRTIGTSSLRSDVCYDLAPTNALRRAINTLTPPAAPREQLYPKYQQPPCLSRPSSREKRLKTHFPFPSTYQLHHNIHPFASLDVSKELYGHPRDSMVDYRNNVKRSMGKASFFVKTKEEAAECLKKFDMMITRNIAGEMVLKKKD